MLILWVKEEQADRLLMEGAQVEDMHFFLKQM
jgi:hypothetical protein